MYVMFYIVLILTATAVVSIHKFLMSAVESYDGYGNGGSFREWKEFEKQKLGF
jgi:hypothetical protein